MIWLIPWAVAILLMAIQFAHIKKWLSDHNKRRENRMKDYITDVSDEHNKGYIARFNGDRYHIWYCKDFWQTAKLKKWIFLRPPPVPPPPCKSDSGASEWRHVE